MLLIFEQITPSYIQQFVNEHPSLVELQLLDCNFTVDTVLAVIHQLTSLKKFHFRVASRLDYDRIISQLDNQWPLSSIENLSGCFIVTLQR